MADFMFPDVFKEACCAHWLLTRVGYPSSEIYLAVGPSAERGHIDVLVELKHDGESMALRVGSTIMTRDRVVDTWKRAVEAWKALDERDAQNLFLASDMRKRVGQILLEVQDAGFGVSPGEIEDRKVWRAAQRGQVH